MSIEIPNLDNRTYKDLVKEARDRIPRYTPEWTNLNDSDPGMALVKLNAWLTETLLYQLNRLPELNYAKFLELLHVKPQPAAAATTELTFTLKPLKNTTDPLVVPIPKNAQAAVDDPDLTEEVVFETDETLTAINAAIAAIVIKAEDADSGQTLRLITDYDTKDARLTVHHAFYPFGSTPSVDDICLIGILLRPHRKEGKDYSQDVFPSGEMDIMVQATEVFEIDDKGKVIEGPLAETALFEWEVGEQAGALTWEVYVSTEHASGFVDISGSQDHWQRLNLSDDTASLQRSGRVRLEIPENISSVGFHGLPRDFWSALGLKKPPTTIEELTDDLAKLAVDTLDESAWQAMGVPEAELPELMSCCGTVTEAVNHLNGLNESGLVLDPTQVPIADWIKLDVGYDDPKVPAEAMVWLRMRVITTDIEAALINRFLLNTVSATAAVTRLEESLGRSDGRPAQRFNLKRTPVYFDPKYDPPRPDLTLEVIEPGDEREWDRVDDFYRAAADSRVYQLNESSGTIIFGDGEHGRIPVAGAQIVARRYRYGGGALGNAGAGSVTKLKSVLPSVDSVTNLRATSGGKNAESSVNTKLRAAHDFKSRERAVTAEDFALLAKQTPHVAIQRAYALARRKVTADQTIVEADGAVTVIILPYNKQAEPQPSEAQLKAVGAYLNPRRLITTALYVTGPHYQKIKALKAQIRVDQSADRKAISEAAKKTLSTYFHPLHGGEKGDGWPFGQDIYYGNVYKSLLDLDGVRRVINLDISLEGDGAPKGNDGDTIAIDEGALVHLDQRVIDLEVVYDNHR
jgi:hypothetical protein